MNLKKLFIREFIKNKAQNQVLVLILVMTALKGLLIVSFPLFGDEAYYWQWSKHLDWGYYEQGPVLGLVIWIFTGFGKFHSLFFIRWGALILSAITSWNSVEIYKMLFPSSSQKEVFNFALFLQMSTIFFISSVLMVHDSVMVFFYSIFLLLMLNYLERPRSFLLPILSGVVLGCGVMTKLTLGVIYPVSLLFLILNKKNILSENQLRKSDGKQVLSNSDESLFNKGIFIYSLSFFLSLLPMIIWNIHHNWATLHYLIDRKGNPEPWNAKYFFELLGSQFLILSPWFFLHFLLSAFYFIKKKTHLGPHLFAFLFLGGVLPFIILSINHKVEANWPLFTFLPLFFLINRYFVMNEKLRVYKALLSVQIIFIAFLAFSFAFQLHLGLKESSPFFKSDGFHELSIEIEKIIQKYSLTEGSFFYSSSYYQTSSLLSYYTPENPDYYILISSEGSKNYRFWKPDENWIGKDCIYIWRDSEEFNKMKPLFREELITLPFQFKSKDNFKKQFQITLFKTYLGEK